jgi:hypothetical protein
MEWEEEFNEGWFPDHWLIFSFLGDPSVNEHPNVEEFVPLRMQNPQSKATGPSTMRIDLNVELKNMRSGLPKSQRREIDKMIQPVSTSAIQPESSMDDNSNLTRNNKRARNNTNKHDSGPSSGLTSTTNERNLKTTNPTIHEGTVTKVHNLTINVDDHQKNMDRLKVLNMVTYIY